MDEPGSAIPVQNGDGTQSPATPRASDGPPTSAEAGHVMGADEVARGKKTSKPGRPRKKDPRSQRVRLNFSEAELAEVTSRAGQSGLKLGVYLRDVGLGKGVHRAKDLMALTSSLTSIEKDVRFSAARLQKSLALSAAHQSSESLRDSLVAVTQKLAEVLEKNLAAQSLVVDLLKGDAKQLAAEVNTGGARKRRRRSGGKRPDQAEGEVTAAGQGESVRDQFGPAIRDEADANQDARGYGF